MSESESPVRKRTVNTHVGGLSVSSVYRSSRVVVVERLAVL